MSEKEWQQLVTEIAQVNGWRVFHTYDSRRSNPGWPDVVAVRRGRLVAAELKTETGKVTAEQAEWLEALGGVLGVEVFVWRPRDVAAVDRVFA